MISIANRRHICVSDHSSTIELGRMLNQQFKGEFNDNELITFEIDDHIYLTREYKSKDLTINSYRFSLEDEKTVLEPYGPSIYAEDDLFTIHNMKHISKIGFLSNEYTLSLQSFANAVDEGFKELTVNSDGISYSSRSRLIVNEDLELFGKGYKIYIEDPEDQSTGVEVYLWPSDCCFMLTYRYLTNDLDKDVPELFGDTDSSLEKVLGYLMDNITTI